MSSTRPGTLALTHQSASNRLDSGQNSISQNWFFGRTVAVEAEKLDRYGRRVGKVLIDGRDANLALVVAGLAWHYKKYQREQSEADRLLYALAEDEALARGLGLWRDPAPVAPWDWRAGVR